MNALAFPHSCRLVGLTLFFYGSFSGLAPMLFQSFAESIRESISGISFDTFRFELEKARRAKAVISRTGSAKHYAFTAIVSDGIKYGFKVIASSAFDLLDYLTKGWKINNGKKGLALLETTARIRQVVNHELEFGPVRAPHRSSHVVKPTTTKPKFSIQSAGRHRGSPLTRRLEFIPFAGNKGAPRPYRTIAVEFLRDPPANRIDIRRVSLCEHEHGATITKQIG